MQQTPAGKGKSKAREHPKEHGCLRHKPSFGTMLHWIEQNE
jgi:hypothetical protein